MSYMPVLVFAFVLVTIYAYLQRRMLQELGDISAEYSDQVIDLKLEIVKLKREREYLLEVANDGGYYPDVSMDDALAGMKS